MADTGPYPLDYSRCSFDESLGLKKRDWLYFLGFCLLWILVRLTGDYINSATWKATLDTLYGVVFTLVCVALFTQLTRSMRIRIAGGNIIINRTFSNFVIPLPTIVSCHIVTTDRVAAINHRAEIGSGLMLQTITGSWIYLETLRPAELLTQIRQSIAEAHPDTVIPLPELPPPSRFTDPARPPTGVLLRQAAGEILLLLCSLALLLAAHLTSEPRLVYLAIPFLLVPLLLIRNDALTPLVVEITATGVHIGKGRLRGTHITFDQLLEVTPNPSPTATSRTPPTLRYPTGSPGTVQLKLINGITIEIGTPTPTDLADSIRAWLDISKHSSRPLTR